MSTPTCRREEVALCQPDPAVLTDAKLLPPAAIEPIEMSEKQFLRDHSFYSAVSSWLFAISGATNIGVLGVLSQRILMAAEKGLPLFKSNDPAVVPVLNNKKYNRIALAMVAFGGVCMCISNWLESKKVLTEWQLGAGKLKRKFNIADHPEPATPTSNTATDTDTTTPQKNWAAAVQSKTLDNLDISANTIRHG